ncbi:histidine permease [Colletotrichum eremochloae]|nr:histidine permease [Colletotrichum eremochloae]
MAAPQKDEVASSNLQNAITHSDSGNIEKGITNAESTSIHIDRDNADQLQRHLSNRHIQLIAIGGSIGTALFISIGTGLQRGGPASLLIGYTLHSVMVGLVNNGMAEMCTYMPITGSFIRMAGKWVDESFGFMAGWNFFLYEAFLIPFEIAALNLVLTFWRDDIPAAAVCVGCIVLYGLLNVVAVKYFGEAEFWLASGKLLLIAIAFCFTFITMVGGNPQRDAYGFRTWQNPGPFATYISTGDRGRFQGLLASIFSAGFTVVGPEYVSMVAGEAMRPRIYLKQGFKTIYWRFAVFFIGSAIAIGIIIPHNDPKLENAGAGTADGSPYVIAMQNMGINVLPHVINALLCTSIFSAGNAYTYCAMRCLYGLALDGQAPSIFKKCLKNGIPIYAFGITMLFPFLSFLQVSNNTAQVVTWLQSLTQAAQLLNYVVISVVYVFFYRVCKAQGLDRKTLPYYGYFQPYCAYIAIAWMTFMVTCFGYTTFLPGHWDTLTFFSYYTMIFVGIITFSSWKILKRTRFVPATDADLVWDKPIIDAYEAQFTEQPTRLHDDIRKILGWDRDIVK